jgi:adenylate cyclase class 2
MIERELKIPVPGLADPRARLAAAGAKRLHAPQHEVNVLFDTADGRLSTAGEVLRVRQLGEANILTFKGPASFRGTVKERREIELVVASRERLVELFAALGFEPQMRYDKWRESWLLDEVRVELDRTPMGDFVELEGPAEALETIARRIDLDPAAAVAGSYVSLWRDHCRRHPELGLGRDMVFEP